MPANILVILYDFCLILDGAKASVTINKSAVREYMVRDWPIMLIFTLLCYAAVLIRFIYYAQE